MKHVLILVICTLLSAGILCAATSPVPANLMAQPAIASDGASSMTSCIVGEFCGVGADLLAPGEGAPIPWCLPGGPCKPPVVTSAQAGEGAPINLDQERLLMAL